VGISNVEIIGNSLIMSFNVESNYEEEYRKSSIALFVREYKCLIE